MPRSRNEPKAMGTNVTSDNTGPFLIPTVLRQFPAKCTRNHPGKHTVRDAQSSCCPVLYSQGRRAALAGLFLRPCSHPCCGAGCGRSRAGIGCALLTGCSGAALSHGGLKADHHCRHGYPSGAQGRPNPTAQLLGHHGHHVPCPGSWRYHSEAMGKGRADAPLISSVNSLLWRLSCLRHSSRPHLLWESREVLALSTALRPRFWAPRFISKAKPS